MPLPTAPGTLGDWVLAVDLEEEHRWLYGRVGICLEKLSDEENKGCMLVSFPHENLEESHTISDKFS